MTRSVREPRPPARAGFAVVAAVLAVAAVTAGLEATTSTGARLPSVQVLHTVDTGLCPFALDVKVTRTVRTRGPAARSVEIVGPTEIRLRNRSTGRTAILGASGTSSQDRAGNLRFSGRQLWLGSNHVPYLSTSGRGSRLAPHFVLSGAPRARVIDPCALVAESPPVTRPAETEAPWGVPAHALSRFDYAGLTPLVGTPLRHDHVHLSVIVDGRKITLPAGVGQAGPVDRGPGPCPPPPESRTIGDCAPGHYFTARVAASPLQLHTTSGIVHLQSDRRGLTFTLGQFFDVWGVRFDSSCVGGHCTGRGKELRVFVDGKRVTGDPRRIVLLDRQVIAVVHGGPGDFDAVPATYPLRWPVGCGGPGGRTCFPG